MTSIVVIDDVKSSRQILGKIIETIDLNIAIHNFDRADLALGWIKNKTPDLVITDYKLPELDGLKLTERLRSHLKSRKIPVLMIATADDLILPIHARAAGVSAYLSRPVDFHLIRNRITSLLAVHGSRKPLQLVVDNTRSHNPA